MWIEVIVQLLPIIIPMIQDCVDRDGCEATLANLKGMPVRVQWFMFREARKQGYKIRDSVGIARETWELVNEATVEDLEVLLSKEE